TGEHLSGWVSAIELHVAGTPENIESAVRKALGDVDPNLPVLNMMSFEEQVARNFNQERLIARLTELFGFLALILACVGLYGVTAYAVVRRTNEIGIRIALGADRRNVLGLLLRSALAQLGVGLAIGIPIALAGGRVLADQFYGIKSHETFIKNRATQPRQPCRFSSVREPPWASAICLHWTRPIPEPPGLVVKTGTNRFVVLDNPGPSSMIES